MSFYLSNNVMGAVLPPQVKFFFLYLSHTVTTFDAKKFQEWPVRSSASFQHAFSVARMDLLGCELR